MAFEDRFEAIKKAALKAKTDGIEGHFAAQINLTDEKSSGILYFEVSDGVLHVEPYDYVDRDAMLTVSSYDLISILGGRKSFDKAASDGTLIFEGGDGAAETFKKLIKKPEKKTAPKKSASKTASKKDAVKASDKKDKKPKQKQAMPLQADKTPTSDKHEKGKKA